MSEAASAAAAAQVRAALPELALIEDEELRKKVVAAWLEAMRLGGYATVQEAAVLSAANDDPGTGLEHVRATAAMTHAMAGVLTAAHGTDIDVDAAVAGALLHDIGKALEGERGGFVGAAVRHPFLSVHIAMTVGLPARVVHIIAAHTMEGQFVPKRIETTVVKYADFISADALFRRSGENGFAHRPYMYIPLEMLAGLKGETERGS